MTHHDNDVPTSKAQQLKWQQLKECSDQRELYSEGAREIYSSDYKNDVNRRYPIKVYEV